MELILMAFLGIGIASLAFPESEDADTPPDSNVDVERNDADLTSGASSTGFLEEIGETTIVENSDYCPDQIESDEGLHIEIEGNPVDAIQLEPFRLEADEEPAFDMAGGDVMENVDEDMLLNHSDEVDEDAVSAEDFFPLPETDGEEIGIHFSRYSDDDEVHIEIPDNVSGSVHRVDVEVRYEYSASYGGEFQNSNVTREFTFFILTPDEITPDLNVNVENIYDLREYVDFGLHPFGDTPILAAIDNGGIRVTDFAKISDVCSVDDTENYDIESREFVTNYAPSSIVSDREVVSTQKVVVEFDRDVEEY